MPTLTEYWFRNGFWSGTFDGWNQPYAGWAWISNTGGDAATLVWNRQDNETVVDVVSVLDTPGNRATVDALLGGAATRTSGLLAQGVFWGPAVPYYAHNPARHNPGDMLIRVYFNFHIHTPWYCSDADGWIAYYLMIFLDGTSHVQGNVDGWAYSHNGGGPFCTGAINGQLNAAVPAGMANVQGILNSDLAIARLVTFSLLYFLPGSGTKTLGLSTENADQDVAIALLP